MQRSTARRAKRVCCVYLSFKDRVEVAMTSIDPMEQFQGIAGLGLKLMLLLGALSFVLTGLKIWFGAKWKGEAGEERLRRALSGKFETIEDIYLPDPKNVGEWT